MSARSALEIVAKHERESGPLLAAGYEYAGPCDFVLREGTWFDVPTGPHGYPQGTPRACFGNAINAAVIYGLRYVEGYADNKIAEGALIHHAWNLDADGTVVDVTWGAYEHGRCVAPIGLSYCGVEFSVERADDATWNGDATILNDHNREWPVLRSKWEGEPEGLTFPPGWRLAALRAYRSGDMAEAQRIFKEEGEL